ncbi:hypothetical protein SK128_016495 [Halocaridina rubra]|uniref:Uncharacterized protein n=1 Tax=Halocaridina rubra TaxID=373956 RepID=A0AAN8XH52_HALRR
MNYATPKNRTQRKAGDSEAVRNVDRIRADLYCGTLESGDTFITRKWIANKLDNSERWVTDNRKK